MMERVIQAVAALCFMCVVATPATAQTAPAQPATLLKAEELDQLVAPIALYPDAMLSEVLMASTYPLEVVEADRWASANKSLKGDALKAAVDKQAWDDSVKSLAATPAVLSMMSTKLDWTQKLGDVVLAQQADVMDSVQRLRAKAQAQNKLATTKEQKVSVQQQASKQVIVIEPAEPDTVYVPYYDPAVVYGGWPYPAYPPYYFPPPGYIAGAAIATGVAFAAGVAVGAWVAHGNYWGGGVNWGGNNINVNRPININNNVVNNWTHNPDHRHGVAYNNRDVAQKFGNNGARANAQARLDFRGHNGQQVLNPGNRNPGDRAGIGDRGNRSGNIGNRGADIGDRGANVANRGKGAVANRARHDSAFSNIQSGGLAKAASARGQASLGGGGFNRGNIAARGGGGGGARIGGGGGGGGGRVGGGGGRRR